MKIYLYKKHEYLSKYKLHIMKPVPVEADINLLTNSPLKPVPVENSPGSFTNDVHNVDLTDSRGRPVRGIIAYKTKKGARAYFSSIKEHCPYTGTMEEMIDSKRTDRPWTNIMPHKKTETQISSYIINPYENMRLIVIDKHKYYYIEDTRYPVLVYIKRHRRINGHDIKTMDYILMARNRARIGSYQRGKRRMFFDVKYGDNFRRVYDFNKIDNDIIDTFNNKGKAMAVSREQAFNLFSFVKARYLIRNPGRDYMMKHWHESNEIPVKTPHYLFNEHTSMSFADNFTVIESPLQAVAILSRVSNGIFLPKDRPAKPSYRVSYASGDFILGYPEVNCVK